MESYVTERDIDAKTRQWVERIRPYNQHKMKLRAGKSALLVVDMQCFFLEKGSPTFTSGGLAILPTVRGLIRAFRRAGRPVIYTRHVHDRSGVDLGLMGWWWEGKCIEGSPQSEIHADIAPERGERVVLKHRYSAFYNTDLETVLRGLRIEDLAICGVMTNLCCESTARDAYYRDYRVFVPADGTATADEEMHLASLMNLAFGFAYVTTGERIMKEVGASRERKGRKEGGK